MKNFFIMVFSNVVFFLPLLAGYYFNDYHFFIKAFFYVITIMVFIGEIIILKNDAAFNKYYGKKKNDNIFFWIVCYLLDVPFLLMFVILDYKAIFVLYLIHIFFSISITIKIFEKKRAREEE